MVAFGLWLSQKPSTLVSFFRKKEALPFPLKRSHWLAHLKSLLQTGLTDKSLNAMKLFLIKCRLQKGLM